MYCKKCKSGMRAGVRYCTICGSRINQTELMDSYVALIPDEGKTVKDIALPDAVLEALEKRGISNKAITGAYKEDVFVFWWDMKEFIYQKGSLKSTEAWIDFESMKAKIQNDWIRRNYMNPDVLFNSYLFVLQSRLDQGEVHITIKNGIYKLAQYVYNFSQNIITYEGVEISEYSELDPFPRLEKEEYPYLVKMWDMLNMERKLSNEPRLLEPFYYSTSYHDILFSSKDASNHGWGHYTWNEGERVLKKKNMLDFAPEMNSDDMAWDIIYEIRENPDEVIAYDEVRQMHLLDDQKEELLSRFGTHLEYLQNGLTKIMQKQAQDKGDAGYRKVVYSKEELLGNIYQLAGILFNTGSENRISWSYPIKMEGITDHNVTGLLLIMDLQSFGYTEPMVLSVSATDQAIFLIANAAGSPRSQWYKGLGNQWKKLVIPEILSKEDIISRKIPSLSDVDTYGVTQKREVYTTYCNTRRYGDGPTTKDKYYPAMSLDEVKADMSRKSELKYRGESGPFDHPGYKQIGAYSLIEQGIFYEANGCVYFDHVSGKKYKIANVTDALCVSRFEYQAGMLTVTYITNVKQTGWDVHSDTFGGYAERWDDVYSADVRQERYNVGEIVK